MSIVGPNSGGRRARADSGWARWAAILVFLAAGLLFFGSPGSPLLEPEEAVYAEVPREMLAAGNWITPLRLGRPYYEKPPLLYWLIMAGYWAFGVEEWAARLVPGMFGSATVLITLWWGRRMFGWRAGLAGAMILCLCPRFLHQARMITMDGPLCFWVVSALALGHQAMQPGRLQRGLWLLSAAACGLGLLTKGPVALVLVALPLFVCPLLDRAAARPGLRQWLAYLGTAVGVATPWFAALGWQDFGFLREFFWTHHVVMRFVRPLHPEPVWFYVPVLFLGMLPWTVLLPALIRIATQRSRSMPAELKFLLVSCSWCLVFFSAADCKRMGYILPAMPALALALGHALDQRLEIGAKLPTWITRAVFAAGIGGALFAGWTGLLKPAPCSVLILMAGAGMIWTVCHRGPTPAAAWVSCGLATFVFLFLTVQFVLPSYYRRYSMRDELCSLREATLQNGLPVACYPHHWDSVLFYLQPEDVRSYSHDRREELLEDLARQHATLLFIKTGPALDELIQSLPLDMEFLSRAQMRTVTAGVVQHRGQVRSPVGDHPIKPDLLAPASVAAAKVR